MNLVTCVVIGSLALEPKRSELGGSSCVFANLSLLTGTFISGAFDATLIQSAIMIEVVSHLHPKVLVWTALTAGSSQSSPCGLENIRVVREAMKPLGSHINENSQAGICVARSFDGLNVPAPLDVVSICEEGASQMHHLIRLSFVAHFRNRGFLDEKRAFSCGQIAQ